MGADTAVALKTQTDQIRATEHQVCLRKYLLAMKITTQFGFTSNIQAVV